MKTINLKLLNGSYTREVAYFTVQDNGVLMIQDKPGDPPEYLSPRYWLSVREIEWRPDDTQR